MAGEVRGTGRGTVEIGATVGGDFRVVRELASGGMGAVFVAEQLSTGKPRALKVMHPDLLKDETLQRRFVQEAKVGARIDSEHVVEVIAAGVDDGRPWLAMELLEGKDLAEFLKEAGTLAPADALEIAGQLCHALAAAHAAGIVHRDLKPENVFVARARQKGVVLKVKVLDFGIAKVVADVQATSGATAAVGTPLWMAPEQCQKGGNICPATDVWPLGLIVFRMLTGKRYWREAQQGTSLMTMLREVLFDPIEPASTRIRELGAEALPAAFDVWFARCVDRDPKQRYADAGQAMVALQAVFERGEASEPRDEKRSRREDGPMREASLQGPSVSDASVSETSVSETSLPPESDGQSSSATLPLTADSRGVPWGRDDVTPAGISETSPAERRHGRTIPIAVLAAALLVIAIHFATRPAQHGAAPSSEPASVTNAAPSEPRDTSSSSPSALAGTAPPRASEQGLAPSSAPVPSPRLPIPPVVAPTATPTAPSQTPAGHVDLYDEPPPPMVTTRPETKRNTAVKTKADEDEDY